MLAQPYADMPKVVINSGPGNYGSALGTISIGGSAGLSGARIATGISKLEMLVDGLVSSSSTVAGASGTFSLDTTGLSDGVHEVRIVAINNAQAASEGYQSEPIVVNNHGRSIGFNGGNTTLTSSATTFNLATTAGDGTISQVELTCLGRIVAQASGSPGALSLNPASLAPGDNNIVPVAVFNDGSQVAGGAFVVHVESGTANTWSNGGGNSLWGNAANWSGGLAPQNGDGVARFTGSSGGTVTMAGSISVEELDFGGSGGNYTLSASPGQALTLSASSGPMSQSMINVFGGSQTISAPLVFSSPGNLVNVTNATDRLTISGGIGGAGALTKTGAGMLVLSGSNSYGATRVNAGNIIFNSLAALPASGMILINKPGALNVAGAYSTVTGWLNSGMIDPASTGVLALTGTSNENISMSGYSGLILGAASPGATYSGMLTPTGNTFEFGGGGGTLTVASNLSGTMNLAVGNAGLGAVLLSGTNSYTGDTTVTNGALEVLHPWSLPDGGNVTVGDPSWFGYQVGGVTHVDAPVTQVANTVPEPTTVSIIATGICCGVLRLLVRRNRKQA